MNSILSCALFCATGSLSIAGPRTSAPESSLSSMQCNRSSGVDHTTKLALPRVSTRSSDSSESKSSCCAVIGIPSVHTAFNSSEGARGLVSAVGLHASVARLGCANPITEMASAAAMAIGTTKERRGAACAVTPGCCCVSRPANAARFARVASEAPRAGSACFSLSSGSTVYLQSLALLAHRYLRLLSLCRLSRHSFTPLSKVRAYGALPGGCE